MLFSRVLPAVYHDPMLPNPPASIIYQVLVRLYAIIPASFPLSHNTTRIHRAPFSRRTNRSIFIIFLALWRKHRRATGMPAGSNENDQAVLAHSCMCM